MSDHQSDVKSGKDNSIVRNSYANPDSLYSPIHVPSKRLANRVAIVTGSTRGIGLAIARKLALDGAKVVISSRKEENVREAVAKLKAFNLEVVGLVCHIGVELDRQKLIDFTMKQFNRIDIFVSNVAVNPYVGDILGISESQIDKILDINIKAALLMTQKIVPLMRLNNNKTNNNANKGGNIVFIGSIAGHVTLPCISMYSVSKSALDSLTKHLSRSLAKEHIRVNQVCPGIIATEFSQGPSIEHLADSDLLKIDMQRLGHPDECSGLVSFLCSDEASYLTGETISVSGGYH